MLKAERAALDLICDQALSGRLIKRLELPGIKIRYPVSPDKPFRLQVLKRPSALRRIETGILSVNQQQIHVIRSQPLQTVSARTHHMIVRRIVMGKCCVLPFRHDTDLRHQFDPASQRGSEGQRFPHLPRTRSAAGHGCRIKGGNTVLHTGVHMICQLRRAPVPGS